jgi:anthranilate synthase component 2
MTSSGIGLERDRDDPVLPCCEERSEAGVILVLDNYDSFTFNLVQFLGDLGADPVVVRNDERPVEGLVAMAPERVVVSPGPCTPAEAGVSVEAFRTLGAMGIPMLGVCLGHQSLGEAFGGRTVRARRLMHGKTGEVRHDGSLLFRGIPSPFTVTRYHSLVTDATVLPRVLEPVAWSTDADDEGEIQGMRHRDLPLWGVQFHPESLFSEHGRTLLGNFLAL